MIERVGLLVDVETSDEYRQKLLRWAQDPDDDEALAQDEIDDEVARHTGWLTLDIRPFAVMADGSRVVSDEEHGTWQIDMSPPLVAIADGEHFEPPARTAAMVEEAVREDAFEDDQTAWDRWGSLAATLEDLGQQVTAEELDGLPVAILLTDRLRSRLGRS